MLSTLSMPAWVSSFAMIRASRADADSLSPVSEMSDESPTKESATTSKTSDSAIDLRSLLSFP